MPQQSTRTRLSHLPLTLLCTLAVAACAGSNGSNGVPGATGATGASGGAGATATCTAKSNNDGTSTITCSDGTSATVSNGTNGAGGPTGPSGGSGAPGANGSSCTVVDNGNGTRTISCGAGTSVTVTNAVVDYSQMNAAEQADSNPAAVITAVSIPADGRPVVTLKVSDRKGNGIQKLSLVAVAPNVPVSWRFALLQLVPGGATGVNASAADTWVSYMPANATSTASTESANVDATKGGTLTDNADGTYSYRFLKVVNGAAGTAGITYSPTATHRLVVLLSATGNPFAPINLVKDFVPSTGADVSLQNDKVDPASCLTCHTRFRAIAGSTAGFHSGQRYDVHGCIACHNDQRRFATGAANDASIAADGTWTGNLAVLNGDAIDNLPVFIHKIHMGEKLKMTGLSVTAPAGTVASTYTALQFPTYTYPQDVTNCVKCHTAAAKAANFLTTSRRACGSCHDNVSFATTVPPGRVPHAVSLNGGSPQADDTNCAACHGATKFKDVAVVHTPVAPPDPLSTWAGGSNSNTNAAYLANAGAVPAGAIKLSYVLPPAKVGATAYAAISRNPAKNPVIVFKLQQNPGTGPVDVRFNTFAALTDNLIPNFVGSPTVYFAWSVPQDGIATPADFNMSASGYVKRIWNGTAVKTAVGTMSGPDANGFYTITLTGVTVADNATMLTGGVGYAYSLGSGNYATTATDSIAVPATTSQPLTQTGLSAYPFDTIKGTGGLIVPVQDVWAVGSAGSTATNGAYSARRTIVSNDKCNACHAFLGATPTFHAGQRNDGPTCAFCHKPNQTSSGWSASSSSFIHGIHSNSNRTNPFLWHAVSATATYADVTYPAVLNDCEMCHVAGSYDFSSTATLAAVPGMLPSTVGTGRYNSSKTMNPAGYFSISPNVKSDNSVDYGFGFATSNVSATLPDGLSGTQSTGGVTSNCTVATPCTCTAAAPCTVSQGTTAPAYMNAPPTGTLIFKQTIGTGTNAVTSTCTDAAPCTCTSAQTALPSAQPCTATVATCSPTAPCDAQPSTLVISPIVAACTGCHDSPVVIDHMQSNGGVYYQPRSAYQPAKTQEQCLLCHGAGTIASIYDVHMTR